MKTQLKTEVLGIAIELNVSEALQFLKDPTKIQNEVRIMLNGGGVEVPEVSTKKNPRKPIERVPCPHCGRRFGKTGLGTHIKSCPDRPLDDIDEANGESW